MSNYLTLSNYNKCFHEQLRWWLGLFHRAQSRSFSISLPVYIFYTFTYFVTLSSCCETPEENDSVYLFQGVKLLSWSGRCFPNQTEIGTKALETVVVVHLLLPSWERSHLVSPRARETVTVGWVPTINPVNLTLKYHKNK